VSVVARIINHLYESNIELVSYGLAPNPWGFCYETGESTTTTQAKQLDVMLDGLSDSDELELKAILR
jgi:hypothetical protein